MSFEVEMEVSIIPECEAYLEMEHVHWLIHMLLFPHCRCQTSYYTQTNPVGEIKLFWTTEAIDGCTQKHKYQCQDTILKFCNLNGIEAINNLKQAFFCDVALKTGSALVFRKRIRQIQL